MIALALLLATTTPPAQTAADAERAFAAMAQRDGQWAAFRAYADPQARMYVPAPVNAQAWLKDRKNPPAAIAWQPRLVVTSCDGRLAVSTGPWRDGARTGTFTTIWQWRDGIGDGGGWRWLSDHGRDTSAAVPADPVATPDFCTGLATDETVAARGTPPAMGAPAGKIDLARWVAEQGAAGLVIQRDGRMPETDPSTLPALGFGAALTGGHSADNTLAWQSRAVADADPGAHDLAVWQWQANRWALILYELVGVAAR